MKRLINRIKKLSAAELFLVGSIILLIVLVIMRWEWIAREVGQAVSDRFSPIK